jgi:hypothetical protein
MSEFENKLLEIIRECPDVDNEFLEDQLLDNIRKIMPPTCTENERKFLDWLCVFECTGLSGDNEDALYIAPGGSMMHSKDFPDVNLKELVEEKQ